MNIETERLVLTPVPEKYIEKIYQHFNEKVTKYMFPSPAKNIDETRTVVHMFIEQRKNKTDYVYAGYGHDTSCCDTILRTAHR